MNSLSVVTFLLAVFCRAPEVHRTLQAELWTLALPTPEVLTRPRVPAAGQATPLLDQSPHSPPPNHSPVTVAGCSGLEDLPFTLTLSNGLPGEDWLGDPPAHCVCGIERRCPGQRPDGGRTGGLHRRRVSGCAPCPPIPPHTQLPDRRETCASCHKIHTGRWPAGGGMQDFRCEIPRH